MYAQQFDEAGQGQEGKPNARVNSITINNIDKSPPTISNIWWTRNDNGAQYTPNTWANSILTGNMSCTDDHTGIGGVEYSYDRN